MNALYFVNTEYLLLTNLKIKLMKPKGIEKEPSSTTNASETYFAALSKGLADLQRDEVANIRDAAALLASNLEEDRLIHVFGVSGHSVIGCEEFFWRAGGLCAINPLFDQSLNLSGGGIKSTKLERVPGIGDKVIDSAEVKPGDTIIITSIYGMNAATIDAALAAKRHGMKIIAITSRQHASQTPEGFVARHPSGKNLAEIADIVIDNHVPYGDTVAQVKGCPQTVGAVSTGLVSACVQWLVIATAEACVAKGIEPAVWQSANTIGGDERNARYIKKYASRIKAL